MNLTLPTSFMMLMFEEMHFVVIRLRNCRIFKKLVEEYVHWQVINYLKTVRFTALCSMHSKLCLMNSWICSVRNKPWLLNVSFLSGIAFTLLKDG